jgi:hypothetical protein
VKVKGGGQGHVAAVSEGGDDQAARVAQVFVAVLELGVGLLHHAVVILLHTPITYFQFSFRLHSPIIFFFIHIAHFFSARFLSSLSLNHPSKLTIIKLIPFQIWMVEEADGIKERTSKEDSLTQGH